MYDLWLYGCAKVTNDGIAILKTLPKLRRIVMYDASGLTDGETSRILGEDANERIYEEEDPFERDNAGRFRLTLEYRLRSQGVISSFSLGAFGIRDGSERIFLGDRLLRRSEVPVTSTPIAEGI